MQSNLLSNFIETVIITPNAECRQGNGCSATCEEKAQTRVWIFKHGKRNFSTVLYKPDTNRHT